MIINLLLQHIINLNPEGHKNKDSPFKDWKLTGVKKEDDYCHCGTPIKYKYHIINTINNQTTFVGSVCVKKLDQQLGENIANVQMTIIRRKNNSIKKCPFCAYNKCKCMLNERILCHHCDKLFSLKKLINHASKNKLSYPKFYQLKMDSFDKVAKSTWKIGKHKGQSIKQLSPSYINWAMTNLDVTFTKPLNTYQQLQQELIIN